MSAANAICCRFIDFVYFARGDVEIASKKLNIDPLKAHFKKRREFTTGDILEFFRKAEPNIKRTTVSWRIHSLVHYGVLSRTGRGRFVLGEARQFKPQLSPQVKKIYRSLRKQFPYTRISVWNTSLLNEFMLHQPGRFYTIVEVEKESMDAVFFFLKEKHSAVFVDPTADILSRYAIGQKDVIIIKSLVSEAPLQNIDGVLAITIEKLLVDIFSDDVIFTAQQGSEMEHIFEEAFSRYIINHNRFLRYADRRRKRKSINDFLKKLEKSSYGISYQPASDAL